MSRHDQPTHHPIAMSASEPGGNEEASSIAAAKLERQRKRIEEADAALANPLPPSEKPRQVSKGKAKPSWKKFSFVPEESHSDELPGIGPSTVETRVNVFRAPSQAGLTSRPMSRLSSHTYDSMASESDRGQPSFLEQDEFQIYTGRNKARRPYPFEEKPNQQHTVEATFSKREVSDVFGNELPGPSFMDGNPGVTDGLVQFIQHPNGDISAQQWSASRYEWDNIGQFSNIRKKVEGQLAAHRLKGETAAQAKQQNTLAYFRIIAKQREADIMGLPFGQKDITAALPDTGPPLTAPTGPRKFVSNVQMPARPTSTASHAQSEQRGPPLRDETSSNATSNSTLRPQIAQQTARLNPALNFTPLPRVNVPEDPFVTPSQYRNAYDYTNFAHQPHQVHHYGMQLPPFLPTPGRFPQYSPYPTSQAYASTRGYNPTLQSYDRAAFDEQYQRFRLQEQTPQAPAFTSEPSLHHPMPHHIRSSSITKHLGVAIPKTQTRLSAPQETREAMRDHVMQMPQQAKERNKSMANIARTVAHDPLLNQRSSPSPELEKPACLVSPGASELTGSTFVDRFGISTNTQTSLPPSLGPAIALPFDTASTAPSENNLRDSSPERNWQHTTGNSYAEEIPTRRYIDFNDEPKKWDPAKLDEWWWSGTKFARHEQFFSSVITADSPSKVHLTSDPASPPSRLPPIGPPSLAENKSEPKYNDKATRFLIPVLENLASYAPGPAQKRDYFSPWTKAPEWAIDRSEKGNESFFDNGWGEPRKRVGRDMKFVGVAMPDRFGAGSGMSGGFEGIDRRFGYGGVF